MQQAAVDSTGRHQIICLLGEGGMAEVYLGLSRGPANVNKLVVMKRIRSELARDKRFVTMFLDEARLATRLNHPNVVHTYDVLEEGGKYILMMEYLEGHSLFDVLQRIDLQFFPLEEYLWILTQVLAGLQYAHALADYDGSPLGVVHRDVSPGNTFITYSGDVKLVDFGIAKAGGAVSVTQKGTFKGKLAYCAPEQIQTDDPLDARADIFAVGMMLWEGLARERIEANGGYAELVQTRLMGKEPRIREIRKDVDPALAAICDRGMALKPADRYLTAADFQRDLERCLDRAGRRVGRVQVAELMRRHFDAERKHMQKRIEAHLLAIRSAEAADESLSGYEDTLDQMVLRDSAGQPTADKEARRMLQQTEPAQPPLPGVQVSTLLEGVTPLAFRQPGSSSVPGPVAVSASAPVNASSAVWPHRILSAKLLILAAVFVGVATGEVYLWKKGPRLASNSVVSREPAIAAVSRVEAREAPPPNRPAPPAPAPAPLPEMVHLDIAVEPTEAKLTVDDESAIDGNRLRADVPKDRGLHVIRAVAPGFLPFSQTVTFSSDVSLDVRLNPEPSRGDSPAGMKVHSSSLASRAKANAKSKSGSERAKSTSSRSEKPSENPERPPSAKTREQIDYANPYAR